MSIHTYKLESQSKFDLNDSDRDDTKIENGDNNHYQMLSALTCQAEAEFMLSVPLSKVFDYTRFLIAVQWSSAEIMPSFHLV
jgi:hypothetical protein